MPFYSLDNSEREAHLRAHNLNLTPNPQNYCSICYPVSQEYRLDLVNRNSQFANFWYWISHNHSARNYNQYTLSAFERIEESLIEGNLRVCKNLIQSIKFRRLNTPGTALIFYTAQLFVDTNKFITSPTEEQIQQAEQLFAIPNLNLEQLQQYLQQSTMANMTTAQLQQLMTGLQGSNQNITQALTDMFGQHGHFTTAIAALNIPAAPARELSLVKVEPFKGTENEDPHEWIELFNHAAIANNWPNNRKVQIAAGFLKDAALD